MQPLTANASCILACPACVADKACGVKVSSMCGRQKIILGVNQDGFEQWDRRCGRTVDGRTLDVAIIWDCLNGWPSLARCTILHPRARG